MKARILFSLLPVVTAITVNGQTNTLNSTGTAGIGTVSPAALFHIHNEVVYGASTNTQLLLTNGGYRNAESGLAGANQASLAYYFTNYNAGGKGYDRTLDIRVRGDGDGTYGASMIRFFASGYANGAAEQEVMRVHGTGNVGIGTTSPGHKLTVAGNVASNAATSATPYDGSYSAANFVGSSGYWALRTSTNNSCNLDMYNGGSSFAAMTVLQNGSVGIGITSPPGGYKLAVGGKIIGEEVKVKLQTSGWPDYVFRPDYALPSLGEVEKHIIEKGHLPGIPSADEVGKNGLELGDMNAKLLMKIEELTLYVIALKKDNDILRNDVSSLKKKIK